jgi:hypothetical protein
MSESGNSNSPDALSTVVGLAEAIGALRRELAQAQRAAAGEDLRFRLGPVEMEFLVEVTKEGSGEAGIRFWVVNVGGKGGVARATTHRLTLSLQPYDSLTGADATVGSHEEAGKPA